MILAPGVMAPPAARLLAALERRGHPIARTAVNGSGDLLVILGPDSDVGAIASVVAGRRNARILVLSLVGAHPDARAESLRRLWRLEEAARGTGLPVLTLRLGPLLGATSPLWLKLRKPGSLPDRGRMLLNPVAEKDAIETLVRAVAVPIEDQTWYEVIGPEIWSLADLADLAKRLGGEGGGAWEPALEVLAAQRLGEAGPWLDRFGIEARPLAERALEWVSARAVA